MDDELENPFLGLEKFRGEEVDLVSSSVQMCYFSLLEL
jgi:hypothetical protein